MPRKTPVAVADQAAALTHPVRVRAWLLIVEDVANSPSAIAEHLEEPLANVAYHVRRLLDLELIRANGTSPARGAIEHHYRAVKTPADVWFELMPDRPASERVRAAAGELERIADVAEVLYGGNVAAPELRGVGYRLKADAEVLDALERQMTATGAAA